MQKFLMLSVLFASLVISFVAATETTGRRALRRAIYSVVTFNLLYLLFLRFFYGRL